MRPRVSVRAIMGSVLFVAVGFAALRRPSYTSFALVFALTSGVFLLAAHRAGREQAFWRGFVACGLVYLFLAWIPWFYLSVHAEIKLRLNFVGFPKLLNLTRISHLLVSLLIAFIGGIITHYFYGRHADGPSLPAPISCDTLGK
jgi:hypothetical protein